MYKPVRRETTILLFWVVACLMCGNTLAWAEERLIYNDESAYTAIQVIDKVDGLRYMQFGVYEQTAMSLADPTYLHYPYARTIMAGFAFVDPPIRKVLLLGLGGGSLAHVITTKFPEASLEIFEIDPLVVDVAEKFFKFEPGKHGRVSVGDGRRLLRKSTDKYDVIILDAYKAEGIPFHLTTREFMQSVKERLSPGGVVIVHLWADYANKYLSAQVKTIAAVFPRNYTFYDNAGSHMVFATQHENWLSKEQLRQRGTALDEAMRLSFSLAELIDKQYTQDTRMPAVKTLQGQVLTDDFAPVNLLRHQSER